MKTITPISPSESKHNLIKWVYYFVICLYACIASTAFAGTSDKNQDTSQSIALEKGRLYTEWLYTGELELLLEQLTFDMTLEELIAYRDLFFSPLGQEQQLVVDRVTPVLGYLVYVRIAYFENAPIPLAVQWYLNADYKVEFVVDPGFPEAPSDYLDYQTNADLRLPFKGLWFVGSGGLLIEQNHHASFPPQRFALDILIRKNGKTFKGDGSNNEQYYCFGKPIFSPGEGTVIDVIDGVVDNEPGVLNTLEVAGNLVVIDHGNNEYSYLAHFKQGTVAVSVGQTVTSGQYLGQCGNSGTSFEAHLHYHMQNTPYFNIGDGLPVQFQNYYADRKKVKRGEPTIGQFIRPANKKHIIDDDGCGKGNIRTC